MAPDASAVWIDDPEPDDALPLGTELLQGQYTIADTISRGGFGITYLARDLLNRELVIKECFVSTYCRRLHSKVRAASSSYKADLDLLITHFITEAQRMAKLTHPSIVGVRQVFEENDTAYIALEHVKGKDLLQTIQDRPEYSAPTWLTEVTEKILAALSYVHENSLLHCDISPDNILIDELGEPRLIDFGAARCLEQDSNAKRSCPLVIKDGYSPQELYFDNGKSGPWTEIYALGATLAHCVTGEVPKTSPARMSAVVEGRPDPQVPLLGRFPAYPKAFLAGIDKAMSIMPKARYQSVAEWIMALGVSSEENEVELRLPQRPASKVTPSPMSDKPAVTKDLTEVKRKRQRRAHTKGREMAINLSGLAEISGFIGGCLVDSETGLMMASEGGENFDLDSASAANTEVVKAKLKAMQMLKLNDRIEDILITLGKQLHLIRPLEDSPLVFLYVALDRRSANLGMARVQVKNVEQSISM